MKRLIALIFTLFQLFYIVSVSYPFADLADRNAFDGMAVREVRGYSSLLTIVCDNTIASLLKLAEVANLVKTTPGSKNEEGSSAGDDAAKSVGLLPSAKPLLDSRNVLSTLHPGAPSGMALPVLTVFSPKLLLFLLLISCLYFYLFRLKLFYLKPRGALDYAISMFRNGLFTSPRSLWRMRVFLFLVRLKHRNGRIALRAHRKSIRIYNTKSFIQSMIRKHHAEHSLSHSQMAGLIMRRCFGIL